jgi:voltage-gated potassium channel
MRNLINIRFSECFVAIGGITTILLASSNDNSDSITRIYDLICWLISAIFLLFYFIRMHSFLHRREIKFKYFLQPSHFINLLFAAAIPTAVLAGFPNQIARTFGLCWIFKLAEYSSGLMLLGRVFRNRTQTLASLMLGFFIILISAATIIYLLEGQNQPEQFGSISKAMWWAVVTLTTTGYGDVVPSTGMGRFVAGGVMICGIAVFGLFAGILASGFTEEIRRQEFLETWELVAKVPFLKILGADKIASIVKLLKRREFTNGETIVRKGDSGEAMYFIVSGVAEVEASPDKIELGKGTFFGEMALITGEPRVSTVISQGSCILLELDVADFRQLAGDTPELLRAIQEEYQRRLS